MAEEASASKQALTKVRLSGVQKAAALMLAIEKTTAKEVFSKLEDFEVKKITDAMFELGVLHQDTTTNILNEFIRRSASGGGLAATNSEIKSLLADTLDDKRAKDILSSLTTFKDNALKNLGNYDPKTLSNFLINEHPQTIALLLSHLVTDKVGPVIKLLPKDIQSEVVTRIAFLEDITPEALADIEDAVKDALKGLGSASKHKMGGVEYVAEFLNKLDKRSTNDILETMTGSNPELAEAIKQRMFVFEDIAMIDDRGIQEILKNIDNGELALSLKVSTDELKNKVFANMSERAAKILKEDLEVMGPVKVSDVEKAQGNILKVVDRLITEGKIVLAGEGEESVVV